MEQGLKNGKAESIAMGEAKGKTEGKAEGAKETSIAATRNLLSLGIPIDKIAQATLVSITEIESQSSKDKKINNVAG